MKAYTCNHCHRHFTTTHYCPITGDTYEDDLDSLIASGVIAAVTDSAIIGALLGGSITGAIVGDFLNGGSLFDDDDW